jgi:hypothetical protein
MACQCGVPLGVTRVPPTDMHLCAPISLFSCSQWLSSSCSCLRLSGCVTLVDLFDGHKLGGPVSCINIPLNLPNLIIAILISPSPLTPISRERWSSRAMATSLAIQSRFACAHAHRNRLSLPVEVLIYSLSHVAFTPAIPSPYCCPSWHRQNWKRRWFVLSEAAPGQNNLPAKLSYYESHEVCCFSMRLCLWPCLFCQCVSGFHALLSANIPRHTPSTPTQRHLASSTSAPCSP